MAGRERHRQPGPLTQEGGDTIGMKPLGLDLRRPLLPPVRQDRAKQDRDRADLDFRRQFSEPRQRHMGEGRENVVAEVDRHGHSPRTVMAAPSPVMISMNSGNEVAMIALSSTVTGCSLTRPMTRKDMAMR